jgi:hypothetical protein
MGKVRVNGLEGILLCTKVDVLVLNVSCDSSQFNIKALKFLAGADDLKVRVKCETTCRGSPLTVSDVLSGVM